MEGKTQEASEHGLTHVGEYERPGKHVPALFGAAGSAFPTQDSAPGVERTQVAGVSGSKRGQGCCLLLDLEWEADELQVIFWFIILTK